MDKILLYKFFSGATTNEEAAFVIGWIEESEENKKFFIQERRLFDSVLLMNEEDWNKPSMNIRAKVIRLVKNYSQIAAIFILAVTLSYFYLNSKKTAELLTKMNTITVPAGQRVNVTLADGTNVWINAHSTLQYPASFVAENRHVILDGEAYFNVAKDEKKPFIIQTKRYQVEVFGTQFNLEAYDESGVFETALMEGSVKIISNTDRQKSVYLKPGDILREEGGELRQYTIADYDVFRWKEGLICFKDQTFDLIIFEFEKIFGTKIIVNNKKVLEHQYTGKFRHSDGITHALRVLQHSIRFSFYRDDETNIVYIN